MEKRYALFLEVLRRFQAAGLLKELILIGSWCQHFYRSYFAGLRYTPTIMNAQPLRFLDYLLQNTIRIEAEGLKINVPHPAAFALHKLIISARRTKEEKLLKDRKEALAVLTALVRKGDAGEIRSMFDRLSAGWRKRVLNVLTETDNVKIMRILK